MTLRAPFPWFGGKRRVAPLVWARFGAVPNYVEPFAGSLAVLLGRPSAPRVETVNDKDAYLANFWRACQRDPDEVARYADGPVNEVDLHARHRWLVETGRERVERLMSDPDYYDAKVAGWWVWGQCLWIGTGWCDRPEWTGRGHAGRSARGIHTLSTDVGAGLPRKRPALANGNGQGVGVHRVGLADSAHSFDLTRQVPDLSGDSGATGRGIHATAFERKTGGVGSYMRTLSERLRRVRVCCGDWARIVTPAVTTCMGVTGVFLDPPYAAPGVERDVVYNHDDAAVFPEVVRWAIAHGDDPQLRIAVCGYEDEGITQSFGSAWACVPWKAHGGYARTSRGRANRVRERIWFSPHCLSAADDQHALELSHG